MTIKDLKFRTGVHRAFPDKSSARAARFAGVSQRTMQKWMAGETDVPTNIVDAMALQGDLADEIKVMANVQAILDDFIAAGGHPEAAGSMLSAVYQRVLGKEIE